MQDDRRRHPRAGDALPVVTSGVPVADGAEGIIGYMLEQRIQQHFIDSADLKYQVAQSLSVPIAAAVQAILASLTGGGKVLACGNGGSAADAQHFSAEFVGRFERERPELAAIALTTDTSIITAIGNDYSYDAYLFAPGARTGANPATCSLPSAPAATRPMCWLP